MIALAGCGKSTADKVTAATGTKASNCRLVGRMLFGGLSEQVYRCETAFAGSGQLVAGCYAIHGDEVSDVSTQFSTLIRLQGKTVDCGQT